MLRRRLSTILNCRPCRHGSDSTRKSGTEGKSCRQAVSARFKPVGVAIPHSHGGGFHGTLFRPCSQQASALRSVVVGVCSGNVAAHRVTSLIRHVCNSCCSPAAISGVAGRINGLIRRFRSEAFGRSRCIYIFLSTACVPLGHKAIRHRTIGVTVKVHDSNNGRILSFSMTPGRGNRT